MRYVLRTFQIMMPTFGILVAILLIVAIKAGTRCGATISINSREVTTLVFFQNFGKCRWFPVIR